MTTTQEHYNRAAAICQQIAAKATWVNWQHDINRVIPESTVIQDKTKPYGHHAVIVPGLFRFVFSTFYDFDQMLAAVLDANLIVTGQYPGDTRLTITSRHTIIISTDN